MGLGMPPSHEEPTTNIRYNQSGVQGKWSIKQALWTAFWPAHELEGQRRSHRSRTIMGEQTGCLETEPWSVATEGISWCVFLVIIESRFPHGSHLRIGELLEF